MKFVFNELCVLELDAFSQDDFNRWLNNWLDLLAYSYQLFNESPCVYSNTHTRGLLPYPCVDRWLETISPDKRILFYGLIDRQPYLDKNREPQAYDESLSSDFSYEGTPARGLGAAYLLDGISFSFPSDKKWDAHILNVQVYRIHNDNCEESFDVKVRHAIRNDHLDVHKKYMESLEACKKKISSLALLQLHWDNEFPHLERSNSVFEEMEKTTLDQHSFLRVVENLFKLNKFLDKGENDIRKLGNCSDESDTTKQKYGKTREFVFGTKPRRCYLHLKLWKMNWRIQFDIDHEKKIAHVGYIGTHLPI